MPRQLNVVPHTKVFLDASPLPTVHPVLSAHHHALQMMDRMVNGVMPQQELERAVLALLVKTVFVTNRANVLDLYMAHQYIPHHNL